MKQYVRAYEPPESYPPFRRVTQSLPETVLVFDTETETDLEQRLRVGAYQLRVCGRVVQAGVFYPGESLSRFRALMTRTGMDPNAAIVGFNLPFDIARVADSWTEARGSMQGGFSFDLGVGTNSRIRVKHLDSRKSLIDWSGKPSPEGRFVDCMTLSKALLGKGHSLKSLAIALGTDSRKVEGAVHGVELTEEYLEYLRMDVQVTWECYEKLAELWTRFDLGHTHIASVYSEASVGKAALREMNVRPFSETRHKVSDRALAAAMETFYGGRSEVHIRRTPTEVVYVDFLSMYPTVCTLMGLWRFVTAKSIGVKHSEANTQRVARVLRGASLPAMLRQKDWRALVSIVRIRPSRDLLPVRADYAESGEASIGLNYLSTEPLWVTLADAIAAKLVSGKTPEVLDAYTLTARGVQDDLEPWAVMGRPEYTVDPYTGDFYKRLIELRATTEGDERLALKLVANSTCYGIFAELNGKNVRAKKREYYTGSGKLSNVRSKVESPGLYHNPFLATFITGAARLMLATLERQVTDAGLDWVLCDTDSCAISVTSMADRTNVSRIVDSYATLNPYSEPIRNVLKTEHGEDAAAPVYAYAVSAKRYCLFSGSADAPIIDKNTGKISAHGLGHLRAPDGDGKRINGVPAWLYPVWSNILMYEDINRVPRFDGTELDYPAMGQFTVTSPGLVRYNMQPYSFASVFSVRVACPWPNRGVAVSPFGTNARETAANARLVGKDGGDAGTVHSSYLQTYRQVLRHYHEHPESKFDFPTDKGIGNRRHVVPHNRVYTGKEIADLEGQELGLKDAPEPYGEQVYTVKTSEREARRIGKRYREARANRVANQSERGAQ